MATDSETYIESVAPAVPEIATSEVAETAAAIDCGRRNAELDSSTTLAMGGTVIVGADTAVDAELNMISTARRKRTKMETEGRHDAESAQSDEGNCRWLPGGNLS